ncbi:hypothetical protein SD457_25610 [Coprobacillaceae bacterium CR2/5/TPMF4]|nr:hypothetical protein SD457_25610 [Coprobacillaceae bacterium CR2/5/TPMF4]
MTIDEVVDRAMAFIEKDQFSEKWIYTSKLFYKNKLLPLFTDKRNLILKSLFILLMSIHLCMKTLNYLAPHLIRE